MAAEARATITVDGKVVIFEGPAEFVNEQVARYMRGSKSSDTTMNKDSATESLDLKAQPVLAEKQLVTEKQPKGHAETVAVLAFALGEAGHPEFTERDMRRSEERREGKEWREAGGAK